jgi:hypothetical protein
VVAVWVAASAAVHLLLIASESTLAHVTAHAQLASWEMRRGRYRTWFWAGSAATAIGLLAPWLGLSAVATALAGLAAYEHAYVQSAQAVPLA